MIPISVSIIAKNEGDRIAQIIKAVKDVADEILLIDSGSSDDTCKIAMQEGAKVMFNEWNGYGAQKIFAENQCKNNWILNIDADEEVSPQLSSEIKEVFSKEIAQDVAGFRIKIVNKFRFEKAPKKSAYFYNQFRLYNKNLAGFRDSTVHDSVILKEGVVAKILQLEGIIYHQSFKSFNHWIEKINSYSQMQASDALQKGKKIGALKIIFIFPFAFLKAFFVRKYFLYGLDGFIYSFLFAFSRFAKNIKIRELNKEKSQS